jgi:hypothetical protein
VGAIKKTSVDLLVLIPRWLKLSLHFVRNFDILCKQDRDVEQDREDAISYASRNRSRSRASRYLKGQSPEKYLKG